MRMPKTAKIYDAQSFYPIFVIRGPGLKLKGSQWRLKSRARFFENVVVLLQNETPKICLPKDNDLVPALC